MKRIIFFYLAFFLVSVALFIERAFDTNYFSTGLSTGLIGGLICFFVFFINLRIKSGELIDFAEVFGGLLIFWVQLFGFCLSLFGKTIYQPIDFVLTAMFSFVFTMAGFVFIGGKQTPLNKI